MLALQGEPFSDHRHGGLRSRCAGLNQIKLKIRGEDENKSRSELQLLWPTKKARSHFYS